MPVVLSFVEGYFYIIPFDRRLSVVLAVGCIFSVVLIFLAFIAVIVTLDVY